MNIQHRCSSSANDIYIVQGVSAWTKTIAAYEELLLETLCFDLTIVHPHNILLSAAETLQASEHLLSYTWSVLNDTYAPRPT